MLADTYDGSVALSDPEPRETTPMHLAGSDDSGEFAECGRDTSQWAGIDSELVVASSQVLHEGVAAEALLR